MVLVLGIDFQWPQAIFNQEIQIFPIKFSNLVFSVVMNFINCHYTGPISAGHLSVNDVSLGQFTCSDRPSESFTWDNRYTICIGY